MKIAPLRLECFPDLFGAMTKISFQRQKGDASLGIVFCWKLTIDGDSLGPILDQFIPELFYDFIFIQGGGVSYVDKMWGVDVPLAKQTLKTIHTEPVTLALTPPLVLLGARLSLKFAESYWGGQIPANQFLEQKWVEHGHHDLTTFADQVTETILRRRTRRTESQMLSTTLEETEWFSHFSPRHKRRLYKTVFGISKKELRAIQSLHAFLGQACDFTVKSPRIIEYLDAEVFYDQPHFNHLFKKMTDQTPLEYLQAGSILQDNLMAASYNEIAEQLGKI